jgi:hypothetical protein
MDDCIDFLFTRMFKNPVIVGEKIFASAPSLDTGPEGIIESQMCVCQKQ